MLKVWTIGVQLMVMALFSAVADAFIPGTISNHPTTSLVEMGGYVGKPVLQRKNVVLHEGLSLLDQLVTSSIFVAGVYATVLKSDSPEASFTELFGAFGEKSNATTSKPVAVEVGEADTPENASVLPLASAAKAEDVQEEINALEMIPPSTALAYMTEEAEEMSHNGKSGKKRHFVGKVVKKLVMPWREFAEL